MRTTLFRVANEWLPETLMELIYCPNQVRAADVFLLYLLDLYDDYLDIESGNLAICRRTLRRLGKRITHRQYQSDSIAAVGKIETKALTNL